MTRGELDALLARCAKKARQAKANNNAEQSGSEAKPTDEGSANHDDEAVLNDDGDGSDNPDDDDGSEDEDEDGLGGEEPVNYEDEDANTARL